MNEPINNYTAFVNDIRSWCGDPQNWLARVYDYGAKTKDLLTRGELHKKDVTRLAREIQARSDVLGVAPSITAQIWKNGYQSDEMVPCEETSKRRSYSAQHQIDVTRDTDVVHAFIRGFLSRLNQRRGLYQYHNGEIYIDGELHDTQSAKLMALLAEAIPIADTEFLASNRPTFPKHAIQAVLTRPEVPVIKRLCKTPQFGVDGWIKTGYDPTTGALGTFAAPEPFDGDILDAVAAIMEVVCDCPLTHVGKANWVAEVLTHYLAPYINAPLPMFCHIATKRGSGKSNLARVTSIVTSTPPTQITYPTAKGGVPDEIELDKRLLASLKTLPDMILIDNVTGLFGGSSLAACLTSTDGTYHGRVLGHTQSVSYGCWLLWIMTANMCRFDEDLQRRVVVIKFEPDDDPTAKTNFVHQDWLDWCEANQTRLAAAIRYLIDLWDKAGRPLSSDKMASYDRWAGIVGGVLQNAGITGFLEDNRSQVDSLSDGNADIKNEFLEKVTEKYWSQNVLCIFHAKDIVDEYCQVHEISTDSPQASIRMVNRFLKSLIGYSYEGRKLVAYSNAGNKPRYSINRSRGE